MTNIIVPDELRELLTPPPLHPELEPHVYVDGVLHMSILKHPLVFSVPYLPAFNKQINQSYEYKQQACADALAALDIGKYAYLHERPYRMDAIANFLKVIPSYGFTEEEGKKFWYEVAHLHMDSENIGENLEEWTWLWTEQPAERMQWRAHAMTIEEQGALRSMGDEIVVYHGTSMYAEPDLSWTTDVETARWFALRFDNKNPMIYTGKVKRDDVIAYLTGRGEFEIVVPAEKVEIINTTKTTSKRRTG